MARPPLELDDDKQQQAFSEPYLNIGTQEALINKIMELMYEAKLTSHQAKALLNHCLEAVDH